MKTVLIILVLVSYAVWVYADGKDDFKKLCIGAVFLLLSILICFYFVIICEV